MKKTAYKTKTKQEFDELINDLTNKGCTIPSDDLYDYFKKETIVHVSENLSISVGVMVADGYKLVEL